MRLHHVGERIALVDADPDLATGHDMMLVAPRETADLIERIALGT